MFSLLTGVYDSYLAPTQLNLLVVGAPSSGKTALLERLKVTQIPKRTGRSSMAQSPSSPLSLSLHEAFAEGGANAPLKPEPDTCSETTNETTTTPRQQQRHQQQKLPHTSLEDKKKATKPEPKRRFKLSICPAPQRYSNSAQDQEEEFVVEDEEPSVAENDSAQDDELGDFSQPLADAPITPEAPKRVRCHSKEFSVDELDLINSVESKRMSSMESIPLEEVPKFPVLQSAQTTPHLPLSFLVQESAAEFDVQPKKRMLPMSKIRPTSKFRCGALVFQCKQVLLTKFEYPFFKIVVGSNLGKIEMYGAKCHIFDVGGKLRDLWERYYDDCDGVIFCWKLGDDPDDKIDDADEDDDDEVPFDMSKQQAVLEEVRKSIPDDVPFLVFGHVFGNANVEITNRMYSTEAILPHYHNNLTGLCCGSAKTGAGVVSAMEWLIPLSKRQQKERVAAKKEEEKEG